MRAGNQLQEAQLDMLQISKANRPHLLSIWSATLSRPLSRLPMVSYAPKHLSSSSYHALTNILNRQSSSSPNPLSSSLLDHLSSNLLDHLSLNPYTRRPLTSSLPEQLSLNTLLVLLLLPSNPLSQSTMSLVRRKPRSPSPSHLSHHVSHPQGMNSSQNS